jgi:hypothetical protein
VRRGARPLDGTKRSTRPPPPFALARLAGWLIITLYVAGVGAMMHRVLAQGWEAREGQAPSLVFGAIGVALDFQSWRTMVRKQGMSEEQAVELMAGMVRCAAQG